MRRRSFRRFAGGRSPAGPSARLPRRQLASVRDTSWKIGNWRLRRGMFGWHAVHSHALRWCSGTCHPPPLPFAGQGHHHVGVAVLGGTAAALSALRSSMVKVCSGVQHLEEIAEVARVERDADRRRRRKRSAISTCDSPSSAPWPARMILPLAEGEIDAAVLFAGDDRRLADRRVERADGQARS